MKVLCKFCGAKFHSPTKSVECNSCGSTDEHDFIFTENDKPVIPASQMVYEVKYSTQYSSTSKPTITQEEVTQNKLNYMQKNEKGYYNDLEIIRELGMTDTTWLETWYNIGLSNHWIPGAWDPAFTIGSFSECKTFEYLLRRLKGGGWCLGQAFYYKNLCFINQSPGGDEWLVIKDDVDFESYSAGAVINRNLFDFVKDIYRYLATPTDKLRNYEYMSGFVCPEEIEIDGVVYIDEVRIAEERLANYFAIVNKLDIEQHDKMLNRARMIKGKHKQFVRYLQSKGFTVKGIHVFKVYKAEDLKWVSDGLDKTAHAWAVQDYKVDGNRVEVQYELKEFIQDMSLDYNWEVVYND